jgi:hypothetical protein
MNIKSFYFPVEEQDVTLVNGYRANGYKAIVANPQDSPQLVSIVKNSYKLVPNQALITPFMEEIASLKTRWFIDTSHSFVEANRMRLQITFPDVYASDKESKIPLSVYLHNSYDQSEGIRMFWGAIRAICSNGMIMGDVLGKYYARHTKGFQAEMIHRQFDDIAENIHRVESRIQLLDEMPVNLEILEKVQQALGKRRLEEIIATDTLPDISQWDLYNMITWLISHQVEKPARAELQLKTSLVFAL